MSVVDYGMRMFAGEVVAKSSCDVNPTKVDYHVRVLARV